MNKYQSFRFSNGEHYGLLVDKSTGVPFFYQNLYTMIHHRNKSDSINTIKSVVGVLGFFADLCDFLEIDIEDRFQTGNLLTISEIESIALWSKKPKAELSKAKSIGSAKNIAPINIKKLELARYTVVIDDNLVGANTTYNRLTTIAQFVTWLANTISPAAQEAISKMRNRIIHHRPVKISSSSENVPFKSLEEIQKTQLLSLVEPNSAGNPWKNEAVRYRNRLIIHVLMKVGCRKGELLSLKATELNPGDKEIRIIKNHDDPDDPRKNPARIKTSGRNVQIIDDLYSMIEEYIFKYRSTVKGVNKCPFLFVSHQNAGTKAMPLSQSSVDKIISTLSKALGFSVSPHAFRHTWNDAFSEMVEPYLSSGAMSESETEDIRSHHMGWKEGSGTARTYTKRYQQKKAMKFGLHLQKKMSAADKDRIEIINLDVPS